MVGFTILRMYSDCTPNVLRMYSECTPTVACTVCCLTLVSHTRSLRTTVCTSVPAQGPWLMVCLDVWCSSCWLHVPMTEIARILEENPCTIVAKGPKTRNASMAKHREMYQQTKNNRRIRQVSDRSSHHPKNQTD